MESAMLVFEISRINIPLCDLSQYGNLGPSLQDGKLAVNSLKGGTQSWSTTIVKELSDNPKALR
jgi:hypothetical protein